MARKARPPTATAAMLLPKLLEAAPSKSAPEVDEGEAEEVLLEPVGWAVPVALLDDGSAPPLPLLQMPLASEGGMS